MTGTFIDTIVICTMTGLSIVLTGAWASTEARTRLMQIVLDHVKGFAEKR